MKRSYVVTLDEPDCGEVAPVLLEGERERLAALIRGASAESVHVTVSHATGLPLHPFKPQHPFPTP